MSISVKKNKNKSLMRQTLITLCLIILPFNILSVILSMFLMNNLRNSFRQSVEVSLNSYTSILEQRMDNIDYLLYSYPNTETSFVQIFRHLDDWHYNLHLFNIVNVMENAVNLSDSADAMFIYIPEKNDIQIVQDLNFSFGQVVAPMDKQEIVNLLADEEIAKGKWTLVEHNNTQYLFRAAPNKEYFFGAYINCSMLLEELHSNLNFGDVNLFLSSESVQAPRNHLLCSSALSLENTALHCLVHNASMSQSHSVWFGAAIVFLLLSLFMIPVFMIFFKNRINHPLIVLQNAFHRLERGDDQFRITSEAKNTEFENTYQSFNAMAENTVQLKQQALEEQRQQHALTLHNLNLKLDNLQLQIRPHFLSNTMNLLFTLVQNHQEDNAKRLILYISRYFRYMFRHGKEQELFEKEIQLVKEYLSISEMHYSNAFTVSYLIDPILSLMRFPPLLLHNFVENIIKHALIPGQTVHIIIAGEYDEDEQLVTLQISDDGRGMSKEFVDMINTNDFSSIEAGKHIGIRNSINRLNYYYKEGAYVSVESEQGVGTTFTIQIKYNLTMDDTEKTSKGENL